MYIYICTYIYIYIYIYTYIYIFAPNHSWSSSKATRSKVWSTTLSHWSKHPASSRIVPMQGLGLMSSLTAWSKQEVLNFTWIQHHHVWLLKRIKCLSAVEVNPHFNQLWVTLSVYSPVCGVFMTNSPCQLDVLLLFLDLARSYDLFSRRSLNNTHQTLRCLWPEITAQSVRSSGSPRGS